MAYCYEKAIPHSRFLGGPDEWCDTDRLKTMAFALERAERCPTCGTAPWEWKADREAYLAVRETCQGCMRREVVSEERPPDKGERVVLISRGHAEEIARNPEAHVVDSPKLRRQRRAERAAAAQVRA